MASEASVASAGSGIGEAIARGEAFLEGRQRPGGDFIACASTDPTLAAGCVEDPSVFPNCLIAHCLSFSRSEAAARMRSRLHAWLLGEMDADGLWKHWPREHPQAAQLPPDLDDTSCASAALARAGASYPDNRALLLANRRRDGLFYTWFVPWRRWLRHPLMLAMFFRKTSARPGDVDAVVNANALHYLGLGAETAAVAEHLLGVLGEGRERQCDKWYEDPFAIWYFFSRALAGAEPEAGEIIASRIAAAPDRNALQSALAICSLHYWHMPVPSELLKVLLDAQLPSGGWPRAALYHGGRRRRRDGAFDPPHPDTPRWGSEELTAAFALEALSRCAEPV